MSLKWNIKLWTCLYFMKNDLKSPGVRIMELSEVWTMAWVIYPKWSPFNKSWKMTTIACLLAECVYHSTAYASSSGLAFTGMAIANWNSRPANEPKMKHKINSYTYLTWSSLSIFHVSVVYLSSSIFSPWNILMISSGKWRSSNHSSTVCSCGCPPAMLKWLKTKQICTATARK